MRKGTQMFANMKCVRCGGYKLVTVIFKRYGKQQGKQQSRIISYNANIFLPLDIYYTLRQSESMKQPKEEGNEKKYEFTCRVYTHTRVRTPANNIHSEISVIAVFLFSLVEIHFKFLAAITMERHPSGNFDACNGTYILTYTQWISFQKNGANVQQRVQLKTCINTFAYNSFYSLSSSYSLSALSFSIYRSRSHYQSNSHCDLAILPKKQVEWEHKQSVLLNAVKSR